MANDSPLSLRNEVMYCVFVRNYSAKGTFEAVRRDLERIAALGVNTIWLMPIHPVGKVSRKGSLGSPYAISDYRAVNPEFGTESDLRRLVDDIHALGMRCIIDVVYNHTSPDSVLAHDHPEWFFRDESGAPGRHVADWSDIVDLDYGSSPALWDYQIDTLKMWAELVDGFRCDVASVVPLELWLRARAEVAKIRPGALWLAESVERRFISFHRASGAYCATDGELYRAFDLCYDYDVAEQFMAAAASAGCLPDYVRELNAQEQIYPANYGKLRFLENHDRPRAAFLLPDSALRRAWTALEFTLRGTALIYAGQERSAKHTPSLFDRDTVDWSGEDISPLIRRLAEIKRREIFRTGKCSVANPNGAVTVTYTDAESKLVGAFPVTRDAGLIPVSLSDGQYTNLINGETVDVFFGMISTNGESVIIEK